MKKTKASRVQLSENNQMKITTESRSDSGRFN